MTQITLTSDQSEVFASATDVVTFCDASGNVLVRIQATVSDEEAVIIAEAKRRLASDEPRIPSAEVLARLKRLNDQAKQ
jgi:hypothetical protein